MVTINKENITKLYVGEKLVIEKGQGGGYGKGDKLLLNSTKKDINVNIIYPAKALNTSELELTGRLKYPDTVFYSEDNVVTRREDGTYNLTNRTGSKNKGLSAGDRRSEFDKDYLGYITYEGNLKVVNHKGEEIYQHVLNPKYNGKFYLGDLFEDGAPTTFFAEITDSDSIKFYLIRKRSNNEILEIPIETDESYQQNQRSNTIDVMGYNELYKSLIVSSVGAEIQLISIINLDGELIKRIRMRVREFDSVCTMLDYIVLISKKNNSLQTFSILTGDQLSYKKFDENIIDVVITKDGRYTIVLMESGVVKILYTDWLDTEAYSYTPPNFKLGEKGRRLAVLDNYTISYCPDKSTAVLISLADFEVTILENKE